MKTLPKFKRFISFIGIFVLLTQNSFAAVYTFTVGSDSDSGDFDNTDLECNYLSMGAPSSSADCSFRSAVEQANYLESGAPGLNTFTIAFDGTRNIINTNSVDTEAYQVTASNLTIDGTTATPGIGDQLGVTLDGGALGGGSSGYSLLKLYGDNVTLQGMSIINYAGNGVDVAGDNVTIDGNYIGVEADGTTSNGNDYTGVVVNTAADAVISDNVISSNSGGVYIGNGSGTTDTIISGNKIGTDYTGTVDLGNIGSGIELQAGTINGENGGQEGVLIGGPLLSDRNIISGNEVNGVRVVFSAITSGNDITIQNNYVGTDVTGSSALPNGTSASTPAGIYADSTSAPQVDWTIIDNLISGNTGDGVLIQGGLVSLVQGNIIGLNAALDAALGNSGDGIEMTSDSFTVGGDSGAGDGNTIAGNSGHGIYITGTNYQFPNSASIFGNWIGVAAGQFSGLGNGGDGINVDSTTLEDITIGSGVTGYGNYIGGNTVDGIDIVENYSLSANDLKIQGNYIGANATQNFGNSGYGINVESGYLDVVIGTDGDASNDATEGNYISNSGFAGVKITGGVEDLTVAGNLIEDNTQYGVQVGVSMSDAQLSTVMIGGDDCTASLATDYTATTTASNDRNIIGGNDNSGVYIYEVGLNAVPVTVQCNYVGVDSDGSTPNGNGTAFPSGDSSIGVYVADGGTVTIKDNVVDNQTNGGILVESGDVTIEGNAVGINADKLTASTDPTYGGNVDFGIKVDGVAVTSAVIGGATAALSNVVAAVNESLYGLGTGIEIGTLFSNSTPVTIQGNRLSVGIDDQTTTGLAIAVDAFRFDSGDITVGGDNELGSDLTGDIAEGNVVADWGIGCMQVSPDAVTSLSVYGNVFGLVRSGSATAFDTDSVTTAQEGDCVAISTGSTGTLALTTVNIGQGEDTGSGVTDSSRRNIFANSNGRAIYVSNLGDSAVVNIINNYIGNDGNSAFSSAGDAIYLSAAGTYYIGGTGDAEGNIISGNAAEDAAGISVAGDINGTGTLVAYILNNIIGLNLHGDTPVGNDAGIRIGEGTGDLAIHIGDANAGNVISGNNRSAIYIGSGEVNIEGNYIGTDIDGAAAIGNGSSEASSALNYGGIFVSGGNVRIGTDGDSVDDEAEGNVISGNYGQGIAVVASDGGLVIAGNKIGLDATGLNALGNQVGSATYDFGNDASGFNGTGILLADGFGDTVEDPQIGGDIDAESNVIAGNEGVGIAVLSLEGFGGAGQDWLNGFIKNNYLGVLSDGTTLEPNGTADTANIPEVFVGIEGPTNLVSNFSIGSADSGQENVINNTDHVGIYFDEIAPSDLLEGLFANFSDTSEGGYNTFTDVTCAIDNEWWVSYLSSALDDYAPADEVCNPPAEEEETTTTTETASTSSGGSGGSTSTGLVTSTPTTTTQPTQVSEPDQEEPDEQEVETEDEVVEDEPVSEEQIAEETQVLTEAANVVTDNVEEVVETVTQPKELSNVDVEVALKTFEASTDVPDVKRVTTEEAKKVEQLLTKDFSSLSEDDQREVKDATESLMEKSLTKGLSDAQAEGESLKVRLAPGEYIEIESKEDIDRLLEDLTNEVLTKNPDFDENRVGEKFQLAYDLPLFEKQVEGDWALVDKLSFGMDPYAKVVVPEKPRSVAPVLPKALVAQEEVENEEVSGGGLLVLKSVGKPENKVRHYAIDLDEPGKQIYLGETENDGEGKDAGLAERELEVGKYLIVPKDDEGNLGDGYTYTVLDFEAGIKMPEINLVREKVAIGDPDGLMPTPEGVAIGDPDGLMPTPEGVAIGDPDGLMPTPEGVAIGDPDGLMPTPDEFSTSATKFLFNSVLMASSGSVDLAESAQSKEIVEHPYLLTGVAEPGTVIFVAWKSVILSSVVVADASQGEFEVEVPRFSTIAGLPGLDVGEHEVLVFAFDPQRNIVSNVTSLLFRN